MISFIRGTLAGKTADSVLVETGGIGYAIGMSQNSLSKLPEQGQEVLVHTYLQVREDAFALFGFITAEEKDLFMRLISVSGIGPKVALSALSAYTPADLIAAIVSQDTAMVSRIPGIGKKTASRIILELKDALGDVFAAEDTVVNKSDSSVIKQAAEALLSMGFTSAEIEIALKDCPQDVSESVLLQYALKRLGEQ